MTVLTRKTAILKGVARLLNLYLAVTGPLLPGRAHLAFSPCQPATAFLEQNMSFDRIRSRPILYRAGRLRFSARPFENAVFPGEEKRT